MKTIMENIYLIKCVIFLSVAVLSTQYVIMWFALAFLMAVFHLDTQINKGK